MDLTSKHMRMMVCDCVKTVLSCGLKFYKREFHGLYDFRNGSVMAIMLQCCNVRREKVTVKWWNEIRKFIGTTHTDHCNNETKTIRLRSKGKFVHGRLSCYVQMHY